MKGALIKMLIAGGLLLTAFAMVETAISDPDPQFETAARIFMGIFGFIFATVGCVLGKDGLNQLGLFSSKIQRKDISAVIKNEITATLLPDFSSVGEENDAERSLTKFRSNYKDFFEKDLGGQNPAVQNDVTQIFRNILDLQRNRIKNKRLKLRFESERKCYGEYPVKIEKKFDGKYEIQDINEDIAAKSVFTYNGKEVFSRVSAEIAHYTVLNAKSIGEDQIICPNCAAEMSRSDLLDGCDYCGAKFTVEDLGERISDFSLRRNYEIEYLKYQKYRQKFSMWISLVLGSITAIPCAYWTLKILFQSEEMAQTGLFMKFFCAVFTILLPTVAVALLGVIFFKIAVLPFVEIGTFSSYLLKKRKDTSGIAKKQLEEKCSQIRKSDELFSYGNFSSGVANKLATLIYAENEKQSEAFYEGEAPLDLTRYRNVVSFDMLDLKIVEYYISDNLQHIKCEADLFLVEFKDSKCSSRMEKLQLNLVKSADCKTQAVCAPTLMTCHDCGTSRSLLDGKSCLHCGSELVLSKYDWVISSVKYS